MTSKMTIRQKNKPVIGAEIEINGPDDYFTFRVISVLGKRSLRPVMDWSGKVSKVGWEIEYEVIRDFIAEDMAAAGL